MKQSCLVRLINTSISSKTFPSNLKLVIMLFKNKVILPTNRTIALFSIFAKIFEKVIYNWLVAYLKPINPKEFFKMFWSNTIIPGNQDDDDLDVEEWWDNLQEECRLMQLDTIESQIRIGAELAITVGAFLYLAAAVREARFLGTRMFFENLVNKVFYRLLLGII